MQNYTQTTHYETGFVEDTRWDQTLTATVYMSYTGDPATAVENTLRDLPTGFVLEKNYPNPFNPSTTISYSLASSGFVRLKVYDVLGREIATLVESFQPAGWHAASFNGAGHASGVYVYVLSCGGKRFQRTMALIK